jgi:hypothetical protein
MASEAQINANRANAQKSTGPRTEAGKNRSRLNGTRHGLTAMATIMTDEDRRSLQAFKGPYMQDLAPVGMPEYHLADAIATDNWRLVRLRAIEENTFAYGHFQEQADFDTEFAEVHNAFVQARTFAVEQKTFNTLSLYEQRLTRNIHKNMKLFLELQDRRKAEELIKAKAKPLTRSASASYEGLETTNRSGLIPTDVLSQPETAGHGFAFSLEKSTPAAAAKQPTETAKTPPIPTKIAA